MNKKKRLDSIEKALFILLVMITITFICISFIQYSFLLGGLTGIFAASLSYGTLHYFFARNNVLNSKIGKLIYIRPFINLIIQTSIIFLIIYVDFGFSNKSFLSGNVDDVYSPINIIIYLLGFSLTGPYFLFKIINRREAV